MNEASRTARHDDGTAFAAGAGPTFAPLYRQIRELLLRGLMERWYLESFLPSEEIDLIEKNKGGLFKAYRDRSGVIDGIPASIIDACIANFTFTGTPEEIAPRIGELAAFRDAGVDEINFRLHDDPAEAIRLIGEHVVAKLA